MTYRCGNEHSKEGSDAERERSPERETRIRGSCRAEVGCPVVVCVSGVVCALREMAEEVAIDGGHDDGGGAGLSVGVSVRVCWVGRTQQEDQGEKQTEEAVRDRWIDRSIWGEDEGKNKMVRDRKGMRGRKRDVQERVGE